MTTNRFKYSLSQTWKSYWRYTRLVIGTLFVHIGGNNVEGMNMYSFLAKIHSIQMWHFKSTQIRESSALCSLRLGIFSPTKLKKNYMYLISHSSCYIIINQYSSLSIWHTWTPVHSKIGNMYYIIHLLHWSEWKSILKCWSMHSCDWTETGMVLSSALSDMSLTG